MKRQAIKAWCLDAFWCLLAGFIFWLLVIITGVRAL